MAKSGNISVTVSKYHHLGFSWKQESQSIENNTTTISWSLFVTASKYGSISSTASKDWKVVINGVTYSGTNSVAITTNGSAVSVNLAKGTATIPHNTDGSKTFSYSFSQEFGVTISDTYIGTISGSGSGVLESIPRQASVITATAFNDEENPTITYSNPAGESVDNLEACISFTGGTDDVPYRSISKTGTSYTFELTDDERNVLRAAIPNTKSTTVRFYLKTTLAGETYFSYLTREFSIVNGEPLLNNPTVRDVNSDTLALTGDENTLIRYASMAEYSVEAVAKKYATIVSQAVQCGNKKVAGLAQGVIDDVESGFFIFSATDSRNLTAEVTIEKNFIEYVKPTCYQDLTIEMSGETGAKVLLKINGNYFNGSFGAVDNTLKLEVRHTQNDGTMGDWNDLTSVLIPVFDGNTYTLETTISGLDYSMAYTFQCRATDKLNYVESAQYTIRLLPVFDWSENDFNFNVPVNINADNLSMHGETVLRHNKEANNTVLSGSGGHIYLRPGGTDDTSTEAIIYPDGSVNFSGPVMVNGVEIGAASSLVDYVVETGSEAMGTNGTWYWEKWNSGKAVCWGKRNFGSMAVTTSWGNLYRSAVQSQDLPSGLFIAAPEVILINMVDASYGGFIAKHETSAPSATNTGSFIYVRPASATTTRSHISFHVIGRWQADENAPTEITGSVTAINRDSSDAIIEIGIDGTIYPVTSGYTFTNNSGTGFSTGVTITATLVDGSITYWEW